MNYNKRKLKPVLIVSRRDPLNYKSSAIDLIGNTPLLRFKRYCPDGQVFAKCEFLNPISLKDHPILEIILDAEKKSLLKPGSTLIEVTSGNTGMAVAWISAIRGYRAILVMSEIQSLERRRILKAFGAELILTPADQGTAGAREKLKEILEKHPDYFYVGQHVNQANPRAHYLTTGPELWKDTGEKLISGSRSGYRRHSVWERKISKGTESGNKGDCYRTQKVSLHLPGHISPASHDGYSTRICAGND